LAKKKRALSSYITKEAFSTIFKKPATQKYPFVKANVAEGFRGKQIFDIEKCISCGLCSRDCPANAIEMFQVGGKKHPLFHLDRCVFCYQCADSCPKNAIQPTALFELACVDKNSLVIKPERVRLEVKPPT
jgi:formate hydrogenlyase subunit 6/NADH:ubiquinone oxidoreductase subunit I